MKQDAVKSFCSYVQPSAPERCWGNLCRWAKKVETLSFLCTVPPMARPLPPTQAHLSHAAVIVIVDSTMAFWRCWIDHPLPVKSVLPQIVTAIASQDELVTPNCDGRDELQVNMIQFWYLWWKQQWITSKDDCDGGAAQMLLSAFVDWLYSCDRSKGAWVTPSPTGSLTRWENNGQAFSVGFLSPAPSSLASVATQRRVLWTGFLVCCQLVVDWHFHSWQNVAFSRVDSQRERKCPTRT